MTSGSPHPRVAVLIKQVPALDSMVLGSDGRLVRTGRLQMNDYCRRAVTTAVELGRILGGSVTSFTMGPETAVDVLREASLCGVERAVHLSDPALAGSDTLATARALAAVLRRTGEFEAIVTGLNSVDADTGQVPVQVAALLGLPILTGVKRWSLSGGVIRAELEHDDLLMEVEVGLPVVISMAERSCAPCKHKDPRSWPPVRDLDLTTVRAADLGPGPWGTEAGRTVVLGVTATPAERNPLVVRGSDEGAIRAAATHTAALMESPPAWNPDRDQVVGSPPPPGQATTTNAAPRDPAGPGRSPGPPSLPGHDTTASTPPVVVLLEPERDQLALETVGLATTLATATGADLVLAVAGEPAVVPEVAGARLLVVDRGTARQFHSDIVGEMIRLAPSLVIAPSTPWGREVASRLAVSLDAGLTGDVTGIDLVGDGGTPSNIEGSDRGDPPAGLRSEFVALKPAFGGGMLARIGYTSPTALATVRRGALVGQSSTAIPAAGVRNTPVMRVSRLPGSGEPDPVRILGRTRIDDNSDMLSARIVLGIGQGVAPAALPRFETWARRLGASIGATRKVTDLGWLPRSRQIGITAHSISPDLYLAVGVSGKQTHLSGVRGAGVVLAVNPDPDAPIFENCDVGLVAPWEEVMEDLVSELAARLPA